MAMYYCHVYLDLILLIFRFMFFNFSFYSASGFASRSV